MSYRVETASSNRAVCKATQCKEAGIKIDKDELRLGSWVEYQDRGSWAWRHWGCVTGKMISNIRDKIEDSRNAGSYLWDMLDGYDGEEKNSLDRHPDLQEKVRRAVTQGHVDDEDFNGDAEMNKLGESGLFTKENLKKMREAKKEKNQETGEANEKEDADEESKDTKKATPKKRSRVKDESEEEEAALEEQKPAKKKRAKKFKKEEDEEEADVKPTLPKKSRVRKAVKQEPTETDEEEDPVQAAPKKARAKKSIKKEEDEEDDDVKPAVSQKSRVKKAVKKEPAETDEEEKDAQVAPKNSRAKKGIKKEERSEMVKTEDLSDEPIAPKKASKAKKGVKDEPLSEENGFNEVVPKTKKSAKKNRSSKNAVKQEPSDDESIVIDKPKKAKTASAKYEGSSDHSSANVGSVETAPFTADSESYISGIKDERLRKEFEQAFEKGEYPDESEQSMQIFIEKKKSEAVPLKKAGRGKKIATKPVRKSSRTTS